MTVAKQHALKALDAALGSAGSSDHLHQFIAMATSAIDAVAGEKSAYARTADRILKGDYGVDVKARQITQVVHGLQVAVREDLLTSTAELIHAEVFADFLEMAAHLQSMGYKDAAAVIAGSTLEAHLRQLATKHNVPLEFDRNGEMKPKKADTLNAELTAATAYSKLDQKNVVAWLALRNNAAHGQCNAYSKEQVGLMLDGIRNFMTRLPA